MVREKAKRIKVGWKSVYELRESSFQFPPCLYNVPSNR